MPQKMTRSTENYGEMLILIKRAVSVFLYIIHIRSLNQQLLKDIIKCFCLFLSFRDFEESY